MLILYSSHNVALSQLSRHFPNWPARDVSIHQMPKEASVMGINATGLTHCCGSINYTKPLGEKNYHYLINWWCTHSVTPNFYFWVYFFEKVPRVHQDTYPKCSQEFYFSQQNPENNTNSHWQGKDNRVFKEISVQFCTCSNRFDRCLTQRPLEPSMTHPTSCRELDQVLHPLKSHQATIMLRPKRCCCIPRCIQSKNAFQNPMLFGMSSQKD